MTAYAKWLSEVAGELEQLSGLAISTISRKWLSEAYIASQTPQQAAATVTTRYINRLPHAARLKFAMSRSGPLSEADERAIRRTVRRRGR